MLVLALGGCSASDGTGDTFDVVIRNDTDATVWIAQCVNDGSGSPCDRTESDAELKPGESARVGTAVNAPNPWTVRSSKAGPVKGCLDLLFSTYPSGSSSPQVEVSTASQPQCTG